MSVATMQSATSMLRAFFYALFTIVCCFSAKSQASFEATARTHSVVSDHSAKSSQDESPSGNPSVLDDDGDLGQNDGLAPAWAVLEVPAPSAADTEHGGRYEVTHPVGVAHYLYRPPRMNG
jgi:hypothetical protein